jgi:hypothetical protein
MTNFQHFDESLPFRRDTDFATTHLTGIALLAVDRQAGGNYYPV